MVATPFPSNEQPDEVIDRLCRELTGADNVILVREVKARFNIWLGGHPEVIADRSTDISASMVEGFLKRRRPKLGAAQLGLFRPEALVPIGHGKRAWMDDLTRDQFTMWRDIETKSFGQTQGAFEDKVVYWSERLDAWGAYSTLGRLEREEFYWVDPGPFDDDDQDDDQLDDT